MVAQYTTGRWKSNKKKRLASVVWLTLSIGDLKKCFVPICYVEKCLTLSSRIEQEIAVFRQVNQKKKEKKM